MSTEETVQCAPRRMLTEAQVLDLLPFGRTTLFDLGRLSPRT
jgi:hypothetical protein